MFDKVFSVMSENPWWIAGGLLFGVLVLRGSNSGGGGAVDTTAATLQSMQIASDTNVKLSAIGVDYAKVNAAQNMAAMDIKKDIALGAQQIALANVASRTEQNLQVLRNNDNAMQVNAGLAANFLGTAAGVHVADNQMLLQKYNIDVNNAFNTHAANLQFNLQNHAINSQNRQADLNYNADIAAVNADKEINLTSIQRNYDAYIQRLPLEQSRMIEEQATIRNLAWRQKQIAKGNIFGGVLGSLFGAVSNVAGAAIGAMK